jgi:phospholipid/cholesterol/gamma-HCH transport system substrate-binding protein
VIRRSTKVQLAIFVIITLLGLSYVSAEYVGLTKYVTGDHGCTVSADFDNSGGIFSNAEVTYRGVTVGKVGALHIVDKADGLPKGGVRVDLDLDSCSSPRIPASSAAVIANRSVVGEQYVNLVPPDSASNNSPSLEAGALIPATRNSTPVPTETLLKDLDDFITSVPLADLRTTITELDNTFSGRGDDLGSLLDSTNSLLATANSPENLQATLKLIEDSRTVLQTQLDEKQPLQSWTHSLNLLSAQLKKSDPDIRHLLATGTGDLETITGFITDNRTDIGVTLANLATTGDMLVKRIDGIEEVLELYPALAAGGSSGFRPDDSVSGKYQGQLGLVLQATPDPQDCGDPKKDGEGYNGTVRREPGAIGAIPSNVSVRCDTSDPTKNVRGSAHVPGGDPISLSGGTTAYSRASTADTTSADGADKTGSHVDVGPPTTPRFVVNTGRYVTSLTASLG